MKPFIVWLSIALLGTLIPWPAINPLDTPVLLSAAPNKLHAHLIFTHPSARHFAIRIVHQDEGITGETVSFVAPQEAAKLKPPGTWELKTKLLGDTNRFSVAVAGQTNWSNEITVIP